MQTAGEALYVKRRALVTKADVVALQGSDHVS